jgi:hypothetical protein
MNFPEHLFLIIILISPQRILGKTKVIYYIFLSVPFHQGFLWVDSGADHSEEGVWKFSQFLRGGVFIT